MDPLEYDDEPLEERLEPTYAVYPDAAPSFQLMTDFDPSVETPSISVSLEDREECGYVVEAKGLPAVSHDGRHVAHIFDEPPGNADGYVLGSDFIVTTYDREDQPHASLRPLLEGWNERFEDGDTDVRSQCKAYGERLQERVETYNEELSRYRPMEPLDIIADARPSIGIESPLDLVDPQSLRADERPVVARWRAGWLSLRVPGVRVISKHERSDWVVPDDFCDDKPHVRGIYADRRSGRALVWIDYISGACLCDDGEYMRPVTFAPEVFEAIDASPSEPYLEALDAYKYEGG